MSLLQLSVLGCLVLVGIVTAKVCESPECKAIAGEISRNINPDVDPCDDFYQFACGRHGKGQVHEMSLRLVQQELERRQQDLLDDTSLLSHRSKAVRKMKQEYDACLKGGFLVHHHKMNFTDDLEQESFLPEGYFGTQQSLVDSDPNRAKCRNQASTNYRWAFIRTYLDKYFTREDQNETRKMILNIRENIVKQLIDTIPWMTEELKKSTVEKASTLTVNTGYPDWVADDGELDKEYEGSAHGKWPMDPLTVNAHFDFNGHEITIPAGILLGSVYNRKVPNYLNYGGGGFVAGHELSHGLFFWTDDKQSHSSRDDGYSCISKQLTSIKDPTTGSSIWFGFLYLSEMQGDVGGVNASLTAYRKSVQGVEEEQLPGLENFSPTQLFFLSEANTWCKNADFARKRANNFGTWFPFPLHPPEYYRVVIPAMNSPDFAAAFKCKAGSPMNPIKKCKTW